MALRVDITAEQKAKLYITWVRDYMTDCVGCDQDFVRWLWSQFKAEYWRWCRKDDDEEMSHVATLVFKDEQTAVEFKLTWL